MKNWDATHPDRWASLLGTVTVPVFDPRSAAPRPRGVHSLMLDGSGSFVLSTTGPKSLVDGPDPVRWAWSANVRRSVAIDSTGRIAIVRRWDSPGDSEEWPVLRERDALTLFRSFEQSAQPPMGQSVIDRGLNTFRAIRIAIEKRGGSALDVILAFNTVLAWVAQSWVIGGDTEINFADAIRTLHTTGHVSFTPEEISSQLLDFPLGDLARLLREGDSNSSSYLLDADLLIRHASGALYQEAHKQLLVADGATQVEMFPREMLIEGRERPRAPAPTYVHYTPPSLARALVEVALRFLETQADNEVLDVLDPATGSGVFLIESVRETSIQEGLPQRTSFRGFDRSNLAVAMADFCLRNASPTSIGHTVTIQWQNSLGVDDWGAPAIIAMNPPFMAWEDLDHDDRDIVQRTLGAFHRGRPDLAFAFIVRALEALKPGGVMAALVPRSFLDGQSAVEIRAYISGHDKFQIRLIGHFRDFSYFDASVEPAFIVVSRSTRKTPIRIVIADKGFADRAIRALRRGKSLIRVGYELYNIGSDELPADRWTPQPQRSSRFAQALVASTQQTVADFFVPRLGIRVGNKRVFIVAENDLDRLCPTPAERRFFRPIADRIEAGRIQASGYIFYPYDIDGTLLLSTEQELKDAVPRFYNERLHPAEQTLRDRSRYRKWWEVTRPVSTWLAAHTPRIISQAFGRAGNFAFDRDGKYAVVQGVGWCWKHGHPDEDLMLAYIGLLNSAVFDEVLSCFCPRLHGGQYELYQKTIERVPLPELRGVPVGALLSKIGRAISDGRTYDADAQNLLVLRAYGLSRGDTEYAGPATFDRRIVEIAELRDGWFGPGSPRLDPSGLLRFRTFMNHILDESSIPAPYLYPTPDGGAQAEWSFPSWEVSASTSLASGVLHLHATHLESDLSRDAETTLTAPDAVDAFLEFMSEFTR